MSSNGRGVVVEFGSLTEFAGSFPALAGEFVEALGRELQRAMHERVLQLAAELSPVGLTAISRPGHVALSTAWQSGAGTDAAIAAGRPSKVVNRAPHARIAVDMGAPSYAGAHKRRTKAGSVTVAAGRQIGSYQRPLGVRFEVLRRIGEEEEGIVAAAVARAGGGGGA